MTKISCLIKVQTQVATLAFLRIKFYCLVLIVLSSNLLAQSSTPITHKVAYGETLYRIALAYNVSVERVKEWNGLDNNIIKINQELIVGYAEPITPKRIETPEYIQGLERIVEQVETLYYETLANDQKKEKASDTALVNELLNQFDGKAISPQSYQELNQALIKSIEADVGLDFYSSASYNFEPGISDFEDLFFRSRFNAGLDWQLLRSGFYGNKQRIKELEFEGLINDITLQKGRIEDEYIYTYNYVIYTFNKRQLEFVNRRLDIIDKFLEVATQMYLVRATPWEEIVGLKNRKKALENLKRNLSAYNEGFETTYVNTGFNPLVDANNLPLLELDARSILKGRSGDSLDIQLLDLQRQQLDIKYRRNKDMSLRTYARYNVFNSENTTGANYRTFGSVGATFTAPLFQNKHNKEVAEKELKVLESENNKRMTAVNNNLLNLYYEYEYTFKQYLDFYGNKGVVLERLRRNLTKDNLDDPSFTPLSVINGIDEVYNIETELLDIKQNLYLKLLRILTNLQLSDASQIATPISFEGYYDKMAGDRSIYIWSGVFNDFSSIFLSEYLVNNEFEKVYFSSASLPKDQILGFIELLNKQGASVYRLFGDNSMAVNVDTASLDGLLQEIKSNGFHGLHLDVEPHVFPDWNSNRDTYLNNLKTGIQYLSAQLDSGNHLTISIPNFYPEEFLSGIQGHVNEVVVMCYDNIDIDFIVRKIAEELVVFGDKLTIALRTEDFEDRIALEDFVKNLIQVTGIENIAIHDLSRLIKLDEKTILGK